MSNKLIFLIFGKISLLDMHLRCHVGRAVEIVVMMGWHDLQCTWSDACCSLTVHAKHDVRVIYIRVIYTRTTHTW
jgi:hypothetical protein